MTMFLWRALSPVVLFEVLAALACRDALDTRRETPPPDEPRVLRLGDRLGRAKG